MDFNMDGKERKCSLTPYKMPVRVVDEAVHERIHKEKKMQRAKFLFIFQAWKGARHREMHQH